MKNHIFDILILLLLFSMVGLLALGIITNTKTNYLEKENDLLRNTLNIKNGELWQHQIEQNMEKDQPIIF